VKAKPRADSGPPYRFGTLPAREGTNITGRASHPMPKRSRSTYCPTALTAPSSEEARGRKRLAREARHRALA